jgi:hypothetical protein
MQVSDPSSTGGSPFSTMSPVIQEPFSLESDFQPMKVFNPQASGNPFAIISPAIQETFPLENDFQPIQEWIGIADSVYNSEMVQWPSAIMTQPQQMQDYQFGQSPTLSQIPWNPQVTAFNTYAHTGDIAFEPPPGPGYDAYLAGREVLETRQRDVTPTAVSPTGEETRQRDVTSTAVSPAGEETRQRDVTPTAASPTGEDSDHDGWQNLTITSYTNSSIPSQGSPKSAEGSQKSAGGSPFEIIDTPRQTPSPRPHHHDHQHIFTFYPGISKSEPKLPRGRQRRLTSKEKEEAREVRDAKACWACHLSKIKVRGCLFAANKDA